MPCRVLQVHTRYRSGLGGEDSVVEEECALLRQHGHPVEQLILSNSLLNPEGLAGSARAALATIWSQPGYRAVAAAIRQFRPDVMHVHNTFVFLSPSIYWAAAKAGVPVVQTLHNFRLTCANALLLRDDHPCQECIGRIPLPALRHRCAEGSLPRTVALVGMQAVHRRLGTFAHKVDAYVVMSEFARSIMARAGLPAGKIHVKPNFVQDLRSAGGSGDKRRRQILFVGLLHNCKGVDLILDAWSRVEHAGHQLVIVGDGPEQAALQSRFGALSDVLWRGRLPREQAVAEIGRSRFLVMASRTYEGFPIVVAEALSLGTPVVLPRHGGLPSIAPEGESALLFTPLDAGSLADALAQALRLDETAWPRWAASARRTYEERYTPEINYQQLAGIYERVREKPKSR